MSHTRYLTASLVIAALIGVGFLLSVPHTRDLPVKKGASTVAATTPIIKVHDTFKKGVHTLSGSVSVPNACTGAEVHSTLTEDSPQSILLSVAISNDSGICLQVPTTVTFTNVLTAPANLSILATVNGVAASTTSQ